MCSIYLKCKGWLWCRRACVTAVTARSGTSSRTCACCSSITSSRPPPSFCLPATHTHDMALQTRSSSTPLSAAARLEVRAGRRQVKKCDVDTHGEGAECEPITGVWGGAPSGVQRQRPNQVVREGEGQSPPEAENLFAFGAQRKQQICIILQTMTDPQPSS